MCAARRTASKRDEQEQGLVLKSSPLTLLSRFLSTLTILALVFYVAALLISRTDGFRSMVEDRYSKKWDMPFTLQQARLAPNLALEMRGLVSQGFEEQKGPGVSFQWFELNWTWARLFAWNVSAWSDVRASDGIISIQRDAQGAWKPAWFSPLADFLYTGLEPDMKKTDRSDESLFPWNEVQVQIENSDWFGWDAEAQQLFSLRDAQVYVESLQTPYRTWRYGSIEAMIVLGASAAEQKPYHREWLSGPQDEILIFPPRSTDL